MKVPKEYKSSDRFNAGVDVIYDDDSKLQYAPFIYAGVTAGDNGGDSGDEEGEEVMVVHDVNGTLDKTYSEISEAIANGGKTVAIVAVDESNATIVAYVTKFYIDDGTSVCYIEAITGYWVGSAGTIIDVYKWSTDSANGFPVMVEDGGGIS